MPDQGTQWLAIDVGGANLKAAHSAGQAHSSSFALWRDPQGLTAQLLALTKHFKPFDGLALTTTAELCDCFETKAEGVFSVLNAVEAICEGKPVLVWGIDGRFHDPDSIRSHPLVAAAANWLALATIAAKKIGRECGLLIDIGSTTTDIIPLRNGEVAALGRTDLERLQTRELVYAGVRRTPVCALATNLPYRSRDTGLAAELFATTLDVFLTLGQIAENVFDRDTADGKPATIAAARDRLARMVGADREEFDSRDANEFARAAREALVGRLAMAARLVMQSLPVKPTVAVISGSGEFLARDIADRVLPDIGRVISLSDLWNSAASDAACAKALLELLATEAKAS